MAELDFTASHDLGQGESPPEIDSAAGAAVTGALAPPTVYIDGPGSLGYPEVYVPGIGFATWWVLRRRRDSSQKLRRYSIADRRSISRLRSFS